MIPVFYYPEIDTCKTVLDACYKGGLRVAEFVNRGDAAIINFPVLKEYVQKNCPGMLLGVGSILNGEQAEQFIKLGADFIVSPILSEEVAQSCIDHGIYWIPGCATPTEISRAKALGADIIKVFPGDILGPGFIKAVLGPMPGLKLMSTGGVEPTEENLSAWFRAGAVCVGMGSKLLSSEGIKNPLKLTEKITQTIDIINSLRL